MINIINAGVIGCDMTEEFFQTSANNTTERFNWTKIFTTSNATESIAKEYPAVKIVDNIKSIVDDKDITLVIVSSKELAFVKPVIEAGKSVRVI